jgi:hypothetical protein
MSKLQFHLKEKTRGGKVFLVEEYMGGDADTEHFNETVLNVPYSEVKYEDVAEDIENFKKLKKALNMDDYDEVKEEWGEEVASMYDNAPNDPQCDYSTKTQLESVILRGYDNEGNMYETYNLLR